MSENRIPNPNPTPNQFQTPYTANPAVPAGQVVQGVGVTPSALGVKPDARLANAFLTQAFMWMFAGLFVTAGVAYFVQSNASLLNFARGSAFLLIMVQLGIALGIMGAINRLSATAALGLFFIYAATLGISIGYIVSFYTTGSVATAFLSASAMFGAAAIYGHVTKRSLTALRPLLFMGVVGIFVALVLNIFLASSVVTWVISIIGVVLFTVLTAYDVQRIQSGDLAARLGSMEKAAVVGALQLYLDFINLFLFMLRLLGSGR
jgi:FtsH-binding integral membrane protein